MNIFALKSACAHALNVLVISHLSCLLQYMDRGGFEEALDSIDSLIAEYEDLDNLTVRHRQDVDGRPHLVF